MPTIKSDCGCVWEYGIDQFGHQCDPDLIKECGKCIYMFRGDQTTMENLYNFYDKFSYTIYKALKAL